MSRLQRLFRYDRDIFVTVAFFAVILAIPQGAFAWLPKGLEFARYLVRETGVAVVPGRSFYRGPNLGAQ